MVFEKEILKSVCQDDGDFQLINELLEIQKSKYILVNSHGLQHDIENHLETYTRKNRR